MTWSSDSSPSAATLPSAAIVGAARFAIPRKPVNPTTNPADAKARSSGPPPVKQCTLQPPAISQHVQDIPSLFFPYSPHPLRGHLAVVAPQDLQRIRIRTDRLTLVRTPLPQMHLQSHCLSARQIETSQAAAGSLVYLRTSVSPVPPPERPAIQKPPAGSLAARTSDRSPSHTRQPPRRISRSPYIAKMPEPPGRLTRDRPPERPSRSARTCPKP